MNEYIMYSVTVSRYSYSSRDARCITEVLMASLSCGNFIFVRLKPLPVPIAVLAYRKESPTNELTHSLKYSTYTVPEIVNVNREISK